MEKIPFYRAPFKGTLHYENGIHAIIRALESCYANCDVPLGNQALARQRALRNEHAWYLSIYGCPLVQGKIDGEKVILFDDRVVDASHLEDHPLLNPAFLRDHWSSIRNGALAVPREYFSALVELSRTPASGVRKLSYRDLRGINRDIDVTEAATDLSFVAFTGLSDAEKELYLKEQRNRGSYTIVLSCTLKDAEQETPMGSLSAFNNSNVLCCSNPLNLTSALLIGVPASLASSSAESAAKKEMLAAYLEKYVPRACLEECLAGLPTE